MRIIPAILTSDKDDFIRQIEAISEFTDEVDIDILDGTFVVAKTLSLDEMHYLPALIYNFDLMVSDPITYIKKLVILHKEKKIKIGRVFVHSETTFDANEIYDAAEGLFTLGFSLSMETAAENFINLYKKAQMLNTNFIPPLLLKTIQIGKQGNPYHPEVLAKISKVRQSGFNGEIYIDGGVDPDVVFSLKAYNIAGVSVGSYISRSSDPLKSYNNLRDATWKKSLD
ncbi:MAG: hypothetical protein WCJ19_01960 [bacterium]